MIQPIDVNSFRTLKGMEDLKRKYIKLDNLNLCYETIGKGKPVLLIGGSLGGGAEYMYPIMFEIAKKYKAIILHQRGTGGSEISSISAKTISLKQLLNDLESFRHYIGVDKLDIIGHSWGAMLACSYLDKFPDNVSSITLINSMGLSTAAFAYLIDNITQRHSGADLDKLKYLIRKNQTSADFDKSYRDFFKFAQTSYFFDKSMAKSFQKNLSPTFFSLPVYRFMLQDLISNKFDLRNSFKNTTTKVSMIWGRQDIMGAQPIAELTKAFPNMYSRVIERCGHYPWFEQKEKFYEILYSFLK